VSDTAICPYCESEIPTTAKKCRHCGEWIQNECSVCGTPIRGRWARQGLCAEHERKNLPAEPRVVYVEAEDKGGSPLAGFASFVLPGLGQLVQGRLGTTIGHFLTASLLWLVLLGWIVHIVSAVNAANWPGAEKGHRSFRLTT
jgi:TM2 domain-containing membrane protein YozV